MTSLLLAQLMDVLNTIAFGLIRFAAWRLELSG